MFQFGGYNFRVIAKDDNNQVCSIIKGVFYELGLPLIGTAYSDKDTENMYQAYQDARSIYYVVEKKGVIFGGCGIKKLNGVDEDICELQKFYFHKSIRGKGLGKYLLKLCLNYAKEVNYEICYLESTSALKTSHNLYKIFDFKNLNGPLGKTSHYNCDIHMIKELK
tara:strand:- start:178 stop:675 length:498 start_codon:yes stop_codon:yes gene_type:complete